MKADRLVSIVMILLERERVGAQELADLFEVSLRTIYRDMDAISMSGIPLCSKSGAGGGFEILPEYKVDKKVFSADELSALLMGLNNLSGMVRREDLVHTLAKVRSFIPAGRAREVEIKANQICIDTDPWMGNGNIRQHLEIVKSALQENKLLSFTYIDGHGNKTERVVEPYQLVLKSGRWYFQGYCRSRNDYSLFRLSRMTDLQMLQETYSPRDFEKADPGYRTAHGNAANGHKAAHPPIHTGPGAGIMHAGPRCPQWRGILSGRLSVHRTGLLLRYDSRLWR